MILSSGNWRWVKRSSISSLFFEQLELENWSGTAQLYLMLTCFIGAYRFNMKYFFWKAGSKGSVLSATFKAQAQVALQSTDILLGQWFAMSFPCGRRENLYMSVIYPFSEPKSAAAQEPCAYRRIAVPLCSLKEGGELLAPSPVGVKG